MMSVFWDASECPLTVYMQDQCGKMAADSELTKQLCHMTSLFTQKPPQNLNKFRINSNKLG